MADAISAIGSTNSTQSTAQAATNALGMSFESLLKIILTQLTYQDPLKPMENFEFVSQLAQFSQIQQGQVISDSLTQLVSAQSVTQATGLLGRVVDIEAGSTTLVGTVKAVSFQNGDARITIETPSGQTISNLSLTSVSQIREEN
ncbi:flagellar hook capping protein [Rhizorhabdus wittichii DC-6]|nr:flagellar hook capping protein [Rhizorhabdus wittichii DC-6]